MKISCFLKEREEYCDYLWYPLIFLFKFARAIKRSFKGPYTEVTYLKKRDILFLGIPKNANSSMRKAINSYNGIKEDQSFNTIHGYYCRLRKNQLNKLKKEKFIFCFVRNPYDRVLSAYLDIINNKGERDKRWELHGLNKSLKNLDFEDFVKRVCIIPDKNIDIHLQSQTYFIKNQLGIKPDFIGRVENIDQDWENICDLIGDVLPLSHKHKTEKKKKFWNKKLKKRIYQRYKRDFLEFKYKK